MNTTFRFLPLMAIGLLAGCAGDTAPSAAPVAAAAPEPVEAVSAADAQMRAQAAMKDFGERLRSELREAMSRDGAPAAVDFCREEAPRIADSVMAGHGVRLGRVAVPGRHRNPAHMADGWQGEVLEAFQSAVDAGEAPEAQLAVMRDGLPADVELRMARGLRVEAACLVCHGGTVAPEITRRIEQNYPGDRATGFSEGDLRGLVWVEVPAPAGPAR